MKTYEQRIRLIDHHMAVARFIANPAPMDAQVKRLIEHWSRMFQASGMKAEQAAARLRRPT